MRISQGSSASHKTKKAKVPLTVLCSSKHVFIIPSCQPANEINSVEKLTDFDFGKPLPKDKESRVLDSWNFEPL